MCMLFHNGYSPCIFDNTNSRGFSAKALYRNDYSPLFLESALIKNLPNKKGNMTDELLQREYVRGAGENKMNHNHYDNQ